MVSRREQARILAIFSLLGMVAAGIAARLVWLQVGCAEESRRHARRQGTTWETLPARRGVVVDRQGRPLAYDRPVLEVRAEAYFETPTRTAQRPPLEFVEGLTADLVFALGGGRETRRRLRARILSRRADPRFAAPRRRHGRTTYRRRLEFLVAPAVQDAAVVARLRALAERRSWLHLFFRRRHRRAYPYEDVTVGPVGFLGGGEDARGRPLEVATRMETFAGLAAGRSGRREVLRDAVGRRYWSRRSVPPEPPNRLECTLDLDLQRAACFELRRACEAVTARYGSPPRWGALLLAEVDTGEVLAMASRTPGVHPRAAAFMPIRALYPPGSAVKPLVFAAALEEGKLEWEHERIDCRPNTPGNGWRIPGSRRVVRDVHACGVLTPREVLVQSSNIGAAQVGPRLGAAGLSRYLANFGFGERSGLGLPGEKRGVVPRDLARLPPTVLRYYTAPSLSFGYEYNVTPAQVLRAYLRLLSGRRRDLRLFRRIVVDGLELRRRPAGGEPVFLSESTRARIREALAAVVSEEPGATGRHLHALLAELALGHGVVGGKTGTSVHSEIRDGRSVVVRTASFAGFAPVARPRYVALCVLQKDRVAAFWGGRYAAPAAGRLLVHALQRERSAGRVPRSARNGQGVRVFEGSGEEGQVLAGTTTGR